MKTDFDFEKFFQKEQHGLDLFLFNAVEGYHIHGVRLEGMCFTQCEDRDATDFGVYAVRRDPVSGAPMLDWMADLPSREIAEDLVEALPLLAKYVTDATDMKQLAQAMPRVREELSGAGSDASPCPR